MLGSSGSFGVLRELSSGVELMGLGRSKSLNSGVRGRLIAGDDVVCAPDVDANAKYGAYCCCCCWKVLAGGGDGPDVTRMTYCGCVCG